MHIESWYITGLAEASGVFAQVNGGQPFFSFRQTEACDDLVRLVADYFGVGIVYSCGGVKGAKMTTYYRINRLRDLDPVLSHFADYPMQSVQRQALYAVWMDLVHFKKHGRFWVSRHLAEQTALVKNLSALQRRARATPARRP